MKLALASDHAGVALKARVMVQLRREGHEVEDLGTHTTDPVDYPDYAKAVSLAVLSGQAERAILICGSGAGACVAANKFKGIRAATCHDSFSARQCVEDDDVNVLCLGARVIGPELAVEVVRDYVGAQFLRSGTAPEKAGQGCGLRGGVRYDPDVTGRCEDAGLTALRRSAVTSTRGASPYCSTSRPTARFNWLAAVM